MKVYVLARIEPFEADELLDLFETFESADKARRERHDVPHDADRHHVIYPWEVQK